ncbi:MAG TPA: tetratricopeptide repeat protein [Candidatus Obscuribacterales bacterium]
MNKLRIPLCAGLLLFCCAAPTRVAAQVFNTDADSIVTRSAPAVATANTAKSWKHQARSHHSRAMYLADLGRTAEAIEEDRQAISTDPHNPGYQILMGSLLIDDGQLESALATYERVCAQFPDQAPYLTDLMNQLKMGLTLVHLEHAISRSETSPTQSVTSSSSAEQPYQELLPPPVQIEVINPDAKPSPETTTAVGLPPDFSPPKPSKIKTAGKFLFNVLLGVD